MHPRLLVSIAFFILLSSMAYFWYSLAEFKGNNNRDISVILTGFDAEAEPVLKEMNNITVLKDLGMCRLARQGNLYGRKVIVAADGGGKVRTAACLTQILQSSGRNIREVIFMGIAGISREKVSTGEKTHIGDVCINSVAFDFDLQYYSADRAGTSYPDPRFSDLDSSFEATVTTGSRELAGELYRNAGTVKTWQMDECLEATSDSFWHDIRADKRARELGARYLKTAPDAVVIFTSMEAAAAGKTVEWWNADHHTSIAYAYVRSASNFDSVGTGSSGMPARSGEEDLADRSGQDTDKAIRSAAIPVLSLFKNR